MWTIHVRDPGNRRVALLEDYQKLDAVKRLNKTGDWALDLNVASEAALMLTQPGFGIEVVRDEDGAPLISGRAKKMGRKRDASTNTVTIFGKDDVSRLEARMTHPQPASATPPYSTTDYNVVTNTASTVLLSYVNVNCGPAALSGRRTLTLAADPLVGTSVTGRGRWTNLREFLEGLALAGGGLAFDVVQSGTSLVFTPWMPTDKSATVKFSVDLGNMESYEYEITAPEANYIYVGGGGEGTARTIREGADNASIATWAERIEAFVDRRDTSDATELDQEIAKALQEKAGSSSVSFVPIDLDGSTYLVDYTLGDRVAAVVDDTITDLIREVRIVSTPDSSRITPSIGTPSASNALGMFRRLRSLETRTAKLERR